MIGAAKADAPIAVVLIHGGGLAVEGIVAGGRVAILDAFYPGPAGGGAIADALFGVYNPGGKLPYTVYRSEYVEVGVGWGGVHKSNVSLRLLTPCPA